MKILLNIFALSIILTSCSKDDEITYDPSTDEILGKWTKTKVVENYTRSGAQEIEKMDNCQLKSITEFKEDGSISEEIYDYGDSGCELKEKIYDFNNWKREGDHMYYFHSKTSNGEAKGEQEIRFQDGKMIYVNEKYSMSGEKINVYTYFEKK
ncbi:hypothetical protein ACFSTE_15870 [Aquimarina hainanensis]|uniref:Lipocalin-like domain-containing protein n=1 Tax=Aquimarina hainanensis TaxID=1578017 RepID=A0ABW5NAN8_9FLAO